MHLPQRDATSSESALTPRIQDRAPLCTLPVSIKLEFLCVQWHSLIRNNGEFFLTCSLLCHFILANSLTIRELS